MSGKLIEIVAYRAEWPAEFAALAGALRGVTGTLHHIGSTSVQGLAAKDVIDLQLTVPNLPDSSDELIEAAGFKKGTPTSDHCPPGMTLAADELAKKYFRSTGRAAHLHVREQGRFNQRYPLLCRDYLRSHTSAADAYAEIKKQLARYFPNDVDAYYDVKDPVFDVLMAGAADWAKMTDWREPPGD